MMQHLSKQQHNNDNLIRLYDNTRCFFLCTNINHKLDPHGYFVRMQANLHVLNAVWKQWSSLVANRILTQVFVMIFVKNWKSLVEYDLPKFTKYNLKPSPKGIVPPKIKHDVLIYSPCCSKTCMTLFLWRNSKLRYFEERLGQNIIEAH